MNYTISLYENGLLFKVNGFNDKLDQLLLNILSIFINTLLKDQPKSNVLNN